MDDLHASLTRWADKQLAALAALTGSNAISCMSGAQTMKRTPRQSSCRFHAASDGHVALNLARADDLDLLPALFGEKDVTEADIAAHMTGVQAGEIVAHGRALGLAVAHLDEQPVSLACIVKTVGLPRGPSRERPRVIDLSALWAGPLCAHLLGASGAEVVKAESPNRPDALRSGDPALYTRLNGAKEHRTLDFRTAEGRDALIALIRGADYVVEAARPRALLQTGIDADALVREVPGLIWITITAHGIAGDAANWIGFGDDCGVAGGLSAGEFRATGKVGIVGDAIADPLTGLYAARMALEQRQRGTGARLVLSMSGVAALALSEARLC
ncbi:CoA transferase [Sphingomonas sp. SUN039]|uniref:CoA transferase n=1 Tax=Sphingomonas sp. SUN039 TaxID=2937787 RepID=UPI0021648540|nr:CoA transferase [Sphingomonas sp. SUN039]UVO52680.1 CoA transferase [Sphingomonas sp. SUN039]